ncbi:ion transporter [Methanohalophilus halophilus]|uniref:Ion transporter n=1 Tax=Methanohalophilus halophilus TaxID=2177 RepID=A0A1L3Q196_9EURY|nr:ion transporter [Methanohalophilus halophilus]APH38644.1 ion transporter [Methanohalophilus halophilus]RNI08357.1 ion transporter [Methanohalophilus halophilus]SDW18150.1 voltage-gated potassium channel [Methanohalophilus halophilus]
MKKYNPYENRPSHAGWRRDLYDIIFEADTPLGKAFDIALIVAILGSVVIVMLDSVESIATVHHDSLYMLEWDFTILFTIEYILRLICVRDKKRYATSFFGVIDLLAVLPTYLTIILPGGQYLLVIRILRLLRIFRVLKLVQYLSEADLLIRALQESQRKITLFLFTVLNLVVILGSVMYVVESSNPQFTSIPQSIFWAIVTITTVGYGDIIPTTFLGKTIASLVMIIGYSIIAIPTGIITQSIIRVSREDDKTKIVEQTKGNMFSKKCPGCAFQGHDLDAAYCKRCGERLEEE